MFVKSPGVAEAADMRCFGVPRASTRQYAEPMKLSPLLLVATLSIGGLGVYVVAR